MNLVLVSVYVKGTELKNNERFVFI